MKKERQFLYDLHRRRVFQVPFIELFRNNKDLRNELFQQYLEAELVPEVSLYWENFYSKDELDGMIKGGKDSPLSVLKSEFYDLLTKKELPEKYYKHSLEQTQILLELKEVSAHIEDFKKIVLKGKQYDPKEFAENIIKTIVRRGKNISIPKVIDVILNDLLNEKENIHIEGQLIFDNEYQFKKRYGISYNEAKANYRELKRYADNCISKYFNSRPTELPDRVKALFQFIEFLHSNIENFNQYNDLIKELELLDKERNKLSPKNNYKDKLQYDKVQAELESKFKTLQDSTANLIKAKAIELHLCNFDNEPIYKFNGIESDINKLKRNFSKDDLPVIFRHKSLYLEYRTNTHKTFLSLQLFYEDLDEITKSLFDYFKETEHNEFEAFETKAIQVNDISEAVKLFQLGHTKFTLPNTFLNPSSNPESSITHIQPTPPSEKKERISNSIKDLIFFQVYFETENGKVKDNISILRPENWDQHKNAFFNQRMETYKESYTLAEKVKLELQTLEKLFTNTLDYQILKDRYSDYLKALPPQPIAKQQPELNETELSEKVKKHFGFFNGNCPRKHKQILKDEDFNNLIEWTIKYFDNNFKIPEILEPIKVVNTNKTYVQLAFKYLFKKLHKSSPYPDTLFEFYKSAFSPYSEDKKSNFEAVKNNDEVKKLMQIDY